MSDEMVHLIMETTAGAVVSGTAATRELDVDKPYLWRVFRLEATFPRRMWSDLGEIAHEYGFASPNPQVVGKFGGEGEYMLIHDGRVTFMRIAQTEPRFEEVEEGE